MAWTGSRRGKATASAPWRKLRAIILERDHGICHVCRKPGADEVDHIIPVSRRPDLEHDPRNLAAIHDNPCHRQKTAQENQQARGVGARRRRPPTPHPGLLRPGG